PDRDVDRDHGVVRQSPEHGGEVAVDLRSAVVHHDPSGSTSVDTPTPPHRHHPHHSGAVEGPGSAAPVGKAAVAAGYLRLPPWGSGSRRTWRSSAPESRAWSRRAGSPPRARAPWGSGA